MSNPFVGEWHVEHTNPKKSFEGNLLFAEDTEGHLRAIIEIKGYSIDTSIAKMLSPREVEVSSIMRAAMGLVLKVEAILKLTSADTFEGTLRLPAKPQIPVAGTRKKPEDLSFLQTIQSITGAATVAPDLSFDAKEPESTEAAPFPIVAPTSIEEKPSPSKPPTPDAPILAPVVLDEAEEEKVWDLGEVKVEPTKSFKNPEAKQFIKPDDLKRPADSRSPQNPASKLQMPVRRRQPPAGPTSPSQ